MVANGSAASRSIVQCQIVYPNCDKTEIWSFTLISELRSGCKGRPSSWKFIVDYGSSVLLNFVLPRRPGLWYAPLCICLPWVISSKNPSLETSEGRRNTGVLCRFAISIFFLIVVPAFFLTARATPFSTE